VASTLERERKLAGTAAALDVLDGEAIGPRVFASTYHDTADRRLARLGITLRRRVENGVSLWQLKLPRAEGRLELEEPGGPGALPEPLAKLLAGVLHDTPLEEAATLRTRRSGKRVAIGGGTVEATLDEVSLLVGGRADDTFSELELELVDGDAGALAEVERAVVGAGAEEADQRPKLMRYLDVEPESAPGSDGRAIDHVQARLQAQHRALLRHDPGTRVGDDPEDLHDLRVAVRRLRALLRAADSLLVPEWSQPLRDELKWLGGELGPARDLDVLLAHLRAEAERLDGGADQLAFAEVLQRLEAERAGARERLLAALESERYLALLAALEAAGLAPHVRALDAPLDELAGREFGRLAKAVRALGDDPDDDELHRVRIKGKRARYAAELAEPVQGKRAASFLRRAKAFQDVVGEHQDAVVAENRLRAIAAELASAEAVLATGRIVERERRRRRKARAAFPKAWAKLERSGRRTWP
jgi:CHAD domain-containing protein